MVDSERPGRVEPVEGGIQLGRVRGPRLLLRSPVVEPGSGAQPVGQPVGDGEPPGALQLGQHDDHLPKNISRLLKMSKQ